jgi:death-on-curing protein
VNEPIWLPFRAVLHLHSELIREHGGSYGVRDPALIESALARPRRRWEYSEDADLPALAAAYGFGLAKNHGFVDGNKRTAFAAMGVFLQANGLRLVAPEPEAYSAIIALASGELSEEDLARWLRAWLEPAE